MQLTDSFWKPSTDVEMESRAEAAKKSKGPASVATEVVDDESSEESSQEAAAAGDEDEDEESSKEAQIGRASCRERVYVLV